MGQEPECDICGKKGHIAKNCDMRGKCMECKQPGNFQCDCPVWWRRLSHPDLDLPENSESVPVDSAPAGLPAGIPDGAGSPGVVLSSSGNRPFLCLGVWMGPALLRIMLSLLLRWCLLPGR